MKEKSKEGWNEKGKRIIKEKKTNNKNEEINDRMRKIKNGRIKGKWMKKRKSLKEMKEEIDKRTMLNRNEYEMNKKKKKMYKKRNEAIKRKKRY